MINLVIHNNEIDSDRQKAIATAKMIRYAAVDASELGLKECSQLLHFAADIVKMKFNCQNREVFSDVCSNDAEHVAIKPKVYCRKK